MNISSKQARKKKDAYILLVTLAFLVVILIVLGSTMGWMVSNSTMTARNNQFLASEYAAEAATEKALGQMESDWLNGSFSTNASTYAALVPTNMLDWPVKYIFSDSNGVTNQISVDIGTQSDWVALAAPYSGLNAFATPVTVTATATPLGQRFNVPATVSQTFDISSVPVFQYVIFYNINLEIDPGSPMTIDGPVFSNAGIWSGSDAPLVFSNTVWAVQQVVNGVNDPFVNYTGSGASTYLMRGQPVSGVNHVTMPVAGTNDSPNAVEAVLQWPPSAYGLGSAAAYTTDGQDYMANQADLIISNAFNGTNFGALTPAGTNFWVYYQDQNQPLNTNPHNWCPAITWVTNDYYIVSNVTTRFLYPTNYVPGFYYTNAGSIYQVVYAGYSFLTNVLFYDWREGWNGGSGYSNHGKTVYSVQFDVSKFNSWLMNPNVNGGSNYNKVCLSEKLTPEGKFHPIGSVYVYNSVPLTTQNLPAVRIINGSQLFSSYGFSLATPMPLYVKGDFNTTDGSGISDAATANVNHTFPASFLADAITILSSNFVDSLTSKDPAPSPTVDTVNAACLEGIVPSSSTVGTANNTQYSGGVENFLRLLEHWGTLWYNGSIVVMFPSQYATNRWLETGNYYQAPRRNWAFDINFTNEDDLPPMTPMMKTTARSTWTAK